MLLLSTLALLFGVVAARDFSHYYTVPFFEDAAQPDHRDALVMQNAGFDVQHVHENHPAVMANLLREAMSGGAPITKALAMMQDSTMRSTDLRTMKVSASSASYKNTFSPPLLQVSPPIQPNSFSNQSQDGKSPMQQPPRTIQSVSTPGGLRGNQEAPMIGEGKGVSSLDVIKGGVQEQQLTWLPVRFSQQQEAAPPRVLSFPSSARIGHPPPSSQQQIAVQTRSLQQAASGSNDVSHSRQPPTPRIGAIQQQSRSTTSMLVPKKAREFDFIVAGFPKCGTTTLLKTFAAHPEIDMAAQEQCAIAAPVLADAAVLQKLDATLQVMPSVLSGGSSVMKRAFKCPNAMFTYKSIGRLEKHSPNAKLVVGIRHPVKMMQSFYNYRVTEIYERGLAGTEDIPDFLELISGSSEPWKLVSMASVQFELFLQQLGKTTVTPEEFSVLSRYTDFGYELAIKPSSFNVFMYSVDQLEDENVTRTGQLLADLQAYLGLSTPIAPFGHENQNHAVGDAAHPESILICDPKYASIRLQLVQNGIQTATWLRDRFLQSPDVHVSNPKHFLETLETWGNDPCDDEADEESMDDDDGTDASEFDTVAGDTSVSF